jgi:ABC-type multidrug transport system ATPase subunit
LTTSGTGKSRILAAISKHFTSEGIEARVFESGNGLLEEKYDLRCNDFTINLENFGINYCTDEIDFIRKAKEVDVTSITNYVIFYKGERSSRNAQKIHLKDFNPEEERRPKRKFEDYNESASTVKEFLFFLNQSLPVKEIFDRERLDGLYSIISELFEGLSEGKWDNFVKWKEVCFLNAAIKTCKREVTRKTGTPAKPSMTGFKNYALNRITTEVRAKEILNNISKPISEQVELVGNLGANKGELKCKTKVVIQDGNITDSTLSPVAGVNKSTQKIFVRQLKKIVSKVYSKELFESIAELNRIEKVETIKTIHELLLVKRYFSMDDKEYNPSSGESSMLLLQNELGADKDVYILDEPEKSLGNDYINDVIVPLIKEKARAGKKVFISTHDANIAVRTLPYSSIYRCHGPKGYQTYTGNPFSNHLVNICDNNDKIDWKKVSMKTLEGGEEAFGERGKIYGNT